ncbi:hypothetical protein [Catellatospora sp. NPDC049609]
MSERSERTRRSVAGAADERSRQQARTRRPVAGRAADERSEEKA